MQTHNKIQSIKSILTQYFIDKPVVRAYLFGSYARNEMSESSDVDILLELDYSKRIGLLFFRMWEEIQELLDKKVDLITTESISKYIKERVEKDKVLIYER